MNDSETLKQLEQRAIAARTFDDLASVVVDLLTHLRHLESQR